MADNVRGLYKSLQEAGYTRDELGSENAFVQSMSDENERRNIYNGVSKRGNFDLGSYEDYERKYGTNPDEPTELRLNSKWLSGEPSKSFTMLGTEETPQPQVKPQEQPQPQPQSAQTNAEVETAQAQEKPAEKPQKPTAPNEVSPKDDKDNKGYWGRKIDELVERWGDPTKRPGSHNITSPSYATPQSQEDERIKEREEEKKKKQAEYDAMPTGVSGNDWGQFTDEWNNFVEESARLNEDIAKAKGKSEEGEKDLLHPNWDELGNKEGFFDKDTWAIRNEERKREDELLKQREQYVQQMLKGQQVFKEQGGTDKPVEIEQDGKKVYLTSGGVTTDNEDIAQLATTQYNDAAAKLEAQTKETKEQVGGLLEKADELEEKIKERSREISGGKWSNVGGLRGAPMKVAARELSAEELGINSDAVYATQRKLKQVQNFISIAEKYRDDDIGFLKGFGYGAFDKATDIGTYDFGLSDLSGALAAYDILKKTEKGEKLKPEEEALLDAYALEYAARMEYAQYIGRGYGAGAQAVDFGVLAAQLAINPLKGAGAGAEKAFADWLEKKGINYAERSLAGYATRFATRAVANTLPAAGLSILQTPEWLATGIEGTMDFQANGGEALPQETDTGAGVYYSNEGRRTQIKGGIAESDKSLAKSIGQSYKSQLIGNWAMMMVPATGEVTGAIGKGLVSSAEKATPKVVADYISTVGTQEAVRGFDSFLKAVDLPKRSFDFYAAMQLGNIIDAATPGGQELRNEEGTGVFNLDRQVDEYVNALMFETAMGAARGVSYGWGRYQLGRQFDAQYQNMEAGTWRNKQAQLAELTEKFESGDEQQTADAIKSLFADRSLTKEQIEDAVKLGGLSAQRHFCDRMFNETYAGTVANENATGRRIQQGLTSNFNEGLGIVNPNLRIDKDGNVTEVTGDEAAPVTRNSAAAQEAWGKYNIHRQEILDMCGGDILAQLDENPQGTLRTMRNTGVDAVTLQACEEYANAKAKVDGIDEALGAERLEAYISAGKALRMRAYGEDKLEIRHATLKDGRKVDILGETGTSATVIDEDGNTSMVPMSEIVSLDGKEKVSDLMSQQVGQIMADGELERQQLYNPRLQFQPGDTYNIELPNGRRGNVVVIGEMTDKGETAKDGNVFVMMPDSSVEELSMDYIQQQWDMARSEDWANEINERRKRQIEQENAGEIPDQWKPKENEPTEPTEPTEPENTATEETAEGEGEAEGAEGTTEAEGGTEAPAEQPEQRVYEQGDEVQIVDDNGDVVTTTVSGIDNDGKLRVQTDTTVGGKRVSYYTQEQLNELERKAKEAQQPVEQPAETPAEQPTTEETSATETPTEETQQQSALEQLPKKENDKPDFSKAQNASQLVDAMTEYMGGDKEQAKGVINDTLDAAKDALKDAQKTLEDIKNNKRKKGEKKSLDPLENAERRKEAQEAVGEAQQMVEYWQDAADEVTRREEAEKQAVIDQLNAEQAQLAQSQELKDVPEMNEDRPADARARGFRRVNGQKVERQQPIEKIEGKEVNVKFSNDTKQAGHVALVEADQLQPSHTNDGRNPQHFLDEAQPKERTDQASKMGKSDIAKNVNPEEITGSITAYTGAPSVNARGETIQGNNRAAALKEMWKSHPEQAEKYKQYLKDHASEFGLTSEQIDQMKNPVLVNMLDVDDETAIKLGQFTASDTETGGVERIKPQNTREKLGDALTTFARMLMDTGKPDELLASTISKNAAAVLDWMKKEGYITPTQYASTTNSKGYVTEAAKSDLKGILYECVFEGANPALRQKFDDMPAKAQKAILATIWRDGQSPATERMVTEVQRAIDLFDKLDGIEAFHNANTEQAIRDAVRGWYLQTQIDEVTNEPYLPKDKFSNFAVELATLFKAKSQKELTNIFNRIYDLVQGSDQLDLFAKDKKFSLEEAIKKTLDIDYNGKKRGTTLDSDHPTGEGGEQGESGNASGGEPSPQGEGAANGTGGAEGNAEGAVTEPPHTRTTTQEKKAKERRQSVEGEVKKMTDALGTTVRILDSIDQVRDPKTRKAIEAGEKTGEKVTGWYDPVTGEVVVYYPNLTDVNEAKLTYLHEVVGHKGLRALFGDKFEDTMKDVYRSLPKKLQESIQKRMDKKSFKAQGYSDPLVASVEEELSNWAEKNKKPSWWGRTVSYIRDMIRSVVDLEMTDADIDYLLWRSRNNLENQTLQKRATDRVLSERARKANEEARKNGQVLFSTREREWRKLDKNEVEPLMSRMEQNAEVAPSLELTPENWEREFGENWTVRTPLGVVKLGENQYVKTVDSHRHEYFGMIKPTLERPDIIMEKYSPHTDAERDTKYLFVKTFTKPDGGRIVHFESVTVQRDGMEVSISSHEAERKDLKREMQNNKILHLNDKLSPDSDYSLTETLKEGRPDLAPTSDNISESKVTTNPEPAKENGEKSSGELFGKDEKVDWGEGVHFRTRENKDGKKTLLGIHNIGEEKLRKALKLGGLANPSVAVIDAEKSNHNGFGEISLITPPELIDSKTGRNAGTWLGDAWTPSFPETTRHLSEESRQRMEADVERLPKFMQEGMRRSLEAWADGNENSVQVQDMLSCLYLNDKGIAPKVNTSREPYSIAREARDYVTKNEMEQDFHNWLNSLNERYAAKEVIFGGFTPSGNRKYIPATLENVSRWMNRQGQNGSMSGWGGGNITASVLPRVGRLDEIRRNKDRLSEGKQGVLDFDIKKWGPVLYEIERSLENKGGISDGEAVLEDAMGKPNPQAYLRSEYGIELTENESKKINDFIKAVQEERPAMYFETKFNRPVQLNEFAGAVVPEGTSEDIIKALNDAGLKVETYERGNDESRKNAVNGLAESTGVLFRTREKEQAHERAQQISDGAEKRIEAGRRDEAQTKVNDLAKGFGIDGVTLPENADLDNTEGLVVREAARQGTLKDSLGERWDEFLKKVYQNTDEETLKDINEFARVNGWNFAEATERYLASLSDNGAFEQAVERGMWDNIKSAFNGALEGKGFEFGAEDNDIRYALWRNEQNKSERATDSILANATDTAMRDQLGNGGSGDGDIHSAPVLFRHGDNEVARAADDYEKKIASSLYQLKEARNDHLQSMLEAMKLITGDKKNFKVEDIPDAENFYTRSINLSSLNETEREDWKRTLINPMYEEVRKLAHDDPERRLLNNYIISKHGLERNEYMAEREARNAFGEQMKSQKSDATWDDLPDETKEALIEQFRRDYAGLTGLFGLEGKEWQQAEAEARELVENYETAHDTEPLWNKINSLTGAILKKQLDTGIINKATYDRIRKMYNNYVPLRNFEEDTTDDVYAYLNRQVNTYSDPLRKAQGRTSQADNPFVSLEQMVQDVILHGNRNAEVKVPFLNFTLNHPSDLISVDDLWVKYSKDKQMWEPVFPDFPSNSTPQERQAALDAWRKNMEQLAKEYPDEYRNASQEINIPYRITDPSALSEHQVIARVNGKDVVLTVNGNPRLAQAVNGQTNPDVNIEGWMGVVHNCTSYITRFLSAVYTTWEANFMAANYARDIDFANSMAYMKEGADYARKFGENAWKYNAAKMVTLIERRRQGKLDMNDKTDRYFEEFMKNGGETGYTRRMDAEEIRNNITSKLKTYFNTSKSGVEQARKVAEVAGEFGRGYEMSMRFTAFVTSREAGREVKRSVYDAKEISANFNRKGSGGRFYGKQGQTFVGNAGALLSGFLRDVMPFWNAGVQGLSGLVRAAGSGNGAGLRATAVGLGHMGAGAAAPFIALGMINAWNSVFNRDDDDSYWDIDPYTRRSNFCVRTPKGNWAKYPLSIEMRIPYGLGDIFVSYLSGREDKEDALRDVVEVFSQALPWDVMQGQNEESMSSLGGFAAVALTPGAARPIVDPYVRNTDWKGQKLYRDKTDYNKRQPKWRRAYGNTGPVIKGAAKWLNEASGGDDVTKGWFDINPAALQYTLQQSVPGWRLFNQVGNSVDVLLGNKDFDWSYVPIANRFVSTGGKKAVDKSQSKLWNKNREEGEETSYLLREYAKRQQDPEYAMKFQDIVSNTNRINKALVVKGANSRISSSYSIINDPNSTDEMKEIAKETIASTQQLANDMIKSIDDGTFEQKYGKMSSESGTEESAD